MVNSVIRMGGRAIRPNGGLYVQLASVGVVSRGAVARIVPELVAASQGSSSCSSRPLRRFPLQREFSSSTSSYGSGTSIGSSSTAAYESPLQDIFDRMKTNGPTALGTTQEIIDIEKTFKKHQKKLECGIPENALRFSSTSYGRTLLPPYVHANEHRVIMKINTKDLPFTSPYEFDILREIIGDRLNDERKELRLTSNKFGSRIENKRHLVAMLDRIVLSCQKLAAEVKGKNKEASKSEDATKEQGTAQ